MNSEQVVEAHRTDRAPAGRVAVHRRDGESYLVTVGAHRIVVDQPVSAGGRDEGPTPVQLFIASLASCVAYYAGRYLDRHGFPRDDLAVTADFDMATEGPARVVAIRLTVRVPDGLPAGRRAALHAVVSHCTVHNSLARPPRVVIDIE